MEREKDKTTDLVDEKLRGFRNKPAIAKLIVLGIIVAAVLGWLAKVSEDVRKLFGQGATRTYEGAAYDLAENIAFVIDFESIKAKNTGPVPADVKRNMEQHYSEIGSGLNDLGISVDYKSLDYVTRISSMRTNPAASFLAEQIEIKKGKKARQAFDAGLDVWSTYFNAVNEKYTLYDNDIGSGWLWDLDILNLDAERFGVGSLRAEEIDSSSNQELNLSLQVKVADLGREIREKLKN
jgi:hypothetical protein